MQTTIASKNALNLFEIFGLTNEAENETPVQYPELYTEYGPLNTGADIEGGDWWNLNEQPVPTINKNETNIKTAETSQGLFFVILAVVGFYFYRKGF